MRLRVQPCIDVKGNPGWHIQRVFLFFWVDTTNWVWERQEDAIAVAEHLMKEAREVAP